MKISNVQLRTDNDSVSLTADCSLRQFGADTIYFKFDKKYKDFIATDASPFAAALLIPAMKLGSDLVIDGEISEQLYNGLHEIMAVVLQWNLGLKKISIIVNNVKKDSYDPKEAASFFSGGVDSFYTYLKNKNSTDQKIKYFILANGYDISLSNTKLWDVALGTVQDIAQSEGIELITVESNLRDLIEPILTWNYTHGGCLAALGLALRKELNAVYIASTYSAEQLFSNGTHPQLDHCWSTETLKFIHDGTEMSRVGKTKYIAHEPIVLENLRVCYLNKRNKFNCGQCEKCIRTMVGLYIAGTLDQSKTFPHTIDNEVVRKIIPEAEDTAIFQIENLNELRKMHLDEKLQAALEESISHTPSAAPRFCVMDVLKKIWFLDYFYNRSRLYHLAIAHRKT